MERPKQITPIAATLCLTGAIMMAWSMLRVSIYIDQIQYGLLDTETRYFYNESLPAYGAGIVASAIVIILLGGWAIYTSARFVVADIHALKHVKRWCRTQELFLALYIIIAFASSFFELSQAVPHPIFEGYHLHVGSFLYAFSQGAPLCGIGPFIIAGSITKRLSSTEIHRWFATAALPKGKPTD